MPLLLLPCLAFAAAPGKSADSKTSAAACVAAPSAAQPSAAPLCISTGAVLRMRVAGAIKISRLTPGQVIEGIAAEPIYDLDRVALPSGARVRLVVERAQRIKSRRSRFSRLLELFFHPPHQWKRRYRIFFQSATLRLPGGRVTPASLSFVRAEQPEEVQPRARVDRKGSSGNAAGAAARRSNTVLLLKFKRALALPSPLVDTRRKGEYPLSARAPLVVGPGTRARFLLMSSVSASRGHRGEPFWATLIAPVAAGNGAMLPAGSILRGWISELRAPRRFWRSGSLHLSVSRISGPCGMSASAAGSFSSIEADRSARLRLGQEGTVFARPPSKETLFFTLGVTGGISKVADDGFQLVLESLISGATDASTAGVARYVAAAASAAFLATRRGQDVLLPKYTEFEVTFTRPIVLKPSGQGNDGVPPCR